METLPKNNNRFALMALVGSLFIVFLIIAVIAKSNNNNNNKVDPASSVIPQESNNPTENKIFQNGLLVKPKEGEKSYSTCFMGACVSVAGEGTTSCTTNNDCEKFE